jgi:hypothetical protein
MKGGAELSPLCARGSRRERNMKLIIELQPTPPRPVQEPPRPQPIPPQGEPDDDDDGHENKDEDDGEDGEDDHLEVT